MTKLRWNFLAGLLLSGLVTASAVSGPLRFEPIEGQTTGITPALEAWKKQAISRSAKVSWTPTGVRTCDQDGDGQLDLIVTTRHSGWMIIRQADRLAFRDVTASLLQSAGDSLPYQQLSGEGPPIIFDVNRDGFCDFVPTGSTSGRVVLNFGDRLTFGEPVSGLESDNVQVLDLNSDGYLDFAQVTRRFGTSILSEFLNGLPEYSGFRLTTEVIPFPAELPAELQRKLTALQNPGAAATAEASAKSAQDRSPNRDSGPFFWEGDLDGDGLDDCIVQYAGPLSDREHRFAAYCLRNGSGQLEDKTSNLGIPASLVPLLPPIDVTGDGKLDLFTAYGAAAGLYVQKSEGGFRNAGGPIQMLLRPMTHADIPALALHDLDQDGDDDLVASAGKKNELEVFENQGDGVFRRILKIPHWPGAGFDVADLDGNGLPDLVTGGGSDTSGQAKTVPSDPQVTIWMNRSIPGPRRAVATAPGRRSPLDKRPPRSTEKAEQIIETWNVRIPGIYEGTIEILEELAPLDDSK